MQKKKAFRAFFLPLIRLEIDSRRHYISSSIHPQTPRLRSQSQAKTLTPQNLVVPRKRRKAKNRKEKGREEKRIGIKKLDSEGYHIPQAKHKLNLFSYAQTSFVTIHGKSDSFLPSIVASYLLTLDPPRQHRTLPAQPTNPHANR